MAFSFLFFFFFCLLSLEEKELGWLFKGFESHFGRRHLT